MSMRTIELSVGAFVLFGFAALIFLAVNVSGVNLGQDDTSYQINAAKPNKTKAPTLNSIVRIDIRSLRT